MTNFRALGLLVAAACVASACGDDTSPTGGAGGSGGSGGDGGSGVGGEGGPVGTGGDGGTPPASGGGGSGGDDTSPAQASCEEICAFQQGLEDKIMCGYEGAGCVGGCVDTAAQVPDCVDELIAFNDCNVSQPPADFDCVNGNFTLPTGACAEASGAFTDCIQASR